MYIPRLHTTEVDGYHIVEATHRGSPDAYLVLDSELAKSLQAVMLRLDGTMAAPGTFLESREYQAAAYGAVLAFAHSNGVRVHTNEDAAWLDLGFINVGFEYRPWWAFLINPLEFDGEGPSLFLLQFSNGWYSALPLLVWADSLESALEQCAEWLIENAPGFIMAPHSMEISKLIERAAAENPRAENESEDDWTERVTQAWSTGLTSTESGYIASHEWTGREIDDPATLRAAIIVSVRDLVGDCWDADIAERTRETLRSLASRADQATAAR